MKSLLISLIAAANLAAAADKPNIIFIMTDDQGYGDASCYNPESKIPTPGIDRIAAELTQLLESAIANDRTTPGPNQKNDAKVVIWKDAASNKK